jgi:hypothetical protein
MGNDLPIRTRDLMGLDHELLNSNQFDVELASFDNSIDIALHGKRIVFVRRLRFSIP